MNLADELEAPWECFADSAYYDMWCVRRKTDRTFGEGFHLVQGVTAKALRDHLNAAHRERDALKAENEALKARLEVVPGFSESADGIACRDETIRLQDEKIAALKAKNERLREAARSIVAANDMRGAATIDRVSAWAAAFKTLNQALEEQP